MKLSDFYNYDKPNFKKANEIATMFQGHGLLELINLFMTSETEEKARELIKPIFKLILPYEANIHTTIFTPLLFCDLDEDIRPVVNYIEFHFLCELERVLSSENVFSDDTEYFMGQFAIFCETYNDVHELIKKFEKTIEFELQLRLLIVMQLTNKVLAIYIKKIYVELRDEFEKKGFYWWFPTLVTYQQNYDENRLMYFKQFTEASEIDFITSQIDYFNCETNFEYGFESNLLNGVFNYEFEHIRQEVKLSFKKIIEFLEARKKQLESNSIPSSEPISEPPPENPFPKIFTVEGYRLFIKLQTSFISDDIRNVKVNYSYLYHYLNDDLHNHLLCTQNEYIGFVNENYHVSLSKIQPKTIKYDDKVKKKLDGIRKNLSI